MTHRRAWPRWPWQISTIGRSVRVAVATVVAMAPAQAEATSDGGRVARLLGVSPTHAVVVEVAIQVPCSDLPCRAYTVDLRGPDQRRSHARMIATPSLEAYLGKGAPAAEGPFMAEPELTVLELTASADGVTIAAPQGPVTLSLVQAGSADAMAAYERESDQPCLDPTAGPLCSSCKETSRFVSGREASFWACDHKAGTWRGEPLRGRDCDCYAVAPIVAAHLEHTGGPTTRSLFLVAPHQLAQNVIGGTRAAETTELELSSHTLAAYLTPRGEIVVAGSAIHAPSSNGTHFPLLASTRFATAVEASEEVGDPGQIEVLPSQTEVLPSPPRGGPACRGCTLSRSPAPSLLSFVALLCLAALRRLR